MARHDPAEGCGDGGEVQVAGQPHGRGDVVGRALRLELRQEPKPLLGEGERRIPALRPRKDGCGGDPAGRVRGFDGRREPGHRRRLEQGAQRQLDAEDLARPRDHTGGEQGVSAKSKEVLVHPDPLAAQDIGPEAGEQLLDRGARCLGGLTGGQPRLRQGAAVQLAARRQRQRFEHQERRGDHVIRQVPGQSPAQHLDVQGLSRLRHHVGHQPWSEGRILPDRRNGLADAGLYGEDCFDLSQLDPEAPHLDLMVDPAQELERAVRPGTGQVSGPVQPLSRDAAPGVRNEPFRGQVRAAEVAADHARPPQQQLTWHAGRDHAEPPVHHVQPRVVDRAADRHAVRIPAGYAGPARDIDGGLGRTVLVVQRDPETGEETVPQLGRQGFAAGEGLAQRGAVLHVPLVQEGPQHRRHEVDEGDPLLGEGAHQIGAVAMPVRPGQHQPGSGQQRREDLPHREVEAEGGLLQDRIARSQPVDPLRPEQPVPDPAVGHHDTLGAAGRAGGVDHVGQVPRIALREEGFTPLAPGDGAAGAQRQEVHSLAQPSGRAFAQALLGEDQRRAGVRDHVAQAVGRIGRIQGQVCSPGLEDGEKAHDHLNRALGQQADDHIGAHPAAAQPARHAAPQGVQPGVGQDGVSADHRHRLRAARRLRRHQLVQTATSPQVLAGRVPLAQRLVALGVAQQRQVRDAAVRRHHDRAEQDRETVQNPLRRGGVEQVAPEFEAGRDTASALGQRERQVEFRSGAGGIEWLEGQPRQLQRSQGGVLQREHHLEKGRVREAPLGRQLLDQPLERQVLMGIGRERPGADAAGHLQERWISGEVAAQDEGVDEEPDQILDLRPVAVRDRRADEQVLLSGMPAEQRRERGEEDHEQGGPFPAAERMEAGRQLRAELGLAQPAAPAHHWGPRPVDRQLQHGRRPRQALAPPAELRREHLAAQPHALPDREVRVLHRQRRERRGAARKGGGVEGRQLADQHAARPAVRHDVVQGEQRDVLARYPPQQGPAQQRPARQVEGAQRLLRGQAARLVLGLCQSAEVHERQLEGACRRRDPLHRAAVNGGEGGAQRLVPRHDLAQGGGQGGAVQRAGQPHGDRDVVGRAPRLEPGEEPEPLLGERERQVAAAGHRNDGRR